MINLKIRTLLLVITLVSPTVFSYAQFIIKCDRDSVILADLNDEDEDEEEPRPEEVKESDLSEEYLYLVTDIQLPKSSRINICVLDHFVQNVDLTIVIPPPELS